MMFNKQYIHPDIYYIEDFLTEEELSSLHSEALEDNWPEDDSDLSPNSKSNWTGKIKRIKDPSVMRQIALRLHQQLPKEKKYLAFTNSKSIKRYRVGDLDSGGQYAMNPHSDSTKDPWELGAIIYLNDDYEGGDLYYEKLGIALRPKPGTLVIHKSTEECMHRVNKVISGTRYMITFFAGDPANENLKGMLPHQNDKPSL
jgi:predicted 2-oxoglutarate/Fe(II)-dependent dioxygenase YbiX